jgi:hypothetical protein
VLTREAVEVFVKLQVGIEAKARIVKSCLPEVGYPKCLVGRLKAPRQASLI